MSMNEENNSNDYNSIITIVLISLLIIIRISITSYQKQNIIIAWINFFSIFYVMWRIYFRVNIFLKSRVHKSIIFKRQHHCFKITCFIFIIVLLLLMIIYSFLMKYFNDLYEFGSCINDIISLFALLLSIEDEKIIKGINEYYRNL